MTSLDLIPVERVQSRILVLRGQRVIVDSDLARLYEVSTKRLNEQVKRNQRRFPEDFFFQLTKEEKTEVVAKYDYISKLRFSKILPYAFTEHGTIQAANVINSATAEEVGVMVVRGGIQLRQMMVNHKEMGSLASGARRAAPLPATPAHVPRALSSRQIAPSTRATGAERMLASKPYRCFASHAQRV